MKHLLLLLQLQAVSCFVPATRRMGIQHRTSASASTVLRDDATGVDAEAIDADGTIITRGLLHSPESFAEEQDALELLSDAISFSSTATATAASSLDDDDETSYLPEKWKRRLITFEDPYSIHKLSSIAYSISAIIILGTATVRYLDSPEAFAVVPESLLLPTYIFTTSNIVMCAVSVRMAFAHRRYDITARNGFLGVAVSSMFSGFYFLWTSPFGPDVFDNHLVTQLCFAIFVLLDFGFVVDTLLSAPEIVESRRDRKANDYRGRSIVDMLGYVLPIIWGLPFILPTAYLDAILHDRAWFFEQCLYIDQMKGTPGIGAGLSYLQVVLSVAASYGALFVTLRDKKLISKNQELIGISFFSVPAMFYTTIITF